MPHPTSVSAYGIWSLNEIRDAVRGNNWPEVFVGIPFESSYNMPNVDDYLTTSAVPFNLGTTTEFTNELWFFKTGAWSTYTQFWGQWNHPGGSNFQLLFNPASNNELGIQTDSQGFCSSGLVWDSVPVDQWNHLAVVRSGTTTTLYLNGTGYQISPNPDLTADLSYPMGIGRAYNQSSFGFDGYITGFRQIVGEALYTSNFTLPQGAPEVTANTELLLNFRAGNELLDESTNNYTVTQNGGSFSTTVYPFA